MSFCWVKKSFFTPPKSDTPANSKMSDDPNEEDNHEGYEGFGEYMEKKKAKLMQQQKELIQIRSDIFKGLRFYINGYTQPSATELKELILEHGGIYEQYYTSRPNIYMVTTHLPQTKIDKVSENQVIIKPEWIIDSIRSEQLLAINDYRLYHINDKHPTLDGFVDNTKKINAAPPGRTSATDPNFIQNFYKNSRLHHLSTWREELKQFAQTLMKEKVPLVSSGKMDICVLHIDMDCFFVSVSSRDRPDLKGKPVGVSHSAGIDTKDSSSSDLASVNYEARSFGIKNGMYTRKALELCPDLIILPYDFEKYQETAYDLYRILARHAIQFQAVSCDEAFISVLVDEAEETALLIRNEIRKTCGCNASIGIAGNMLLSRLATRKAKPNGQYRVTNEMVEQFMSEQSLEDLPGIGRSTMAKLEEKGWKLCKDLYQVPLESLQTVLGPKFGKNLYEHVRGIDDRELDPEQNRKSVGTEISWGVRFETIEQRDTFIKQMAEEVFERLQALEPRLTAKKMVVKLIKKQENAGEPLKRLGRGICDFLNKTVTFSSCKLSSDLMAVEAIKAVDLYNVPVHDIRGLGMFLVNLEEEKKQFDWSVLVRPPPRSPSNERESYLLARGFSPEIFAELDPQIQEDLLKEWGYYNTALSQSQASPVKRTPLKEKRRISPLKPKVTLDKMFAQQKESRNPDSCPASIDLSFGEPAETIPKAIVISADQPEEIIWCQIQGLLELRNFERASKELARLRGSSSFDELDRKVQTWCVQNIGAGLFIPSAQ